MISDVGLSYVIDYTEWSKNHMNAFDIMLKYINEFFEDNPKYRRDFKIEVVNDVNKKIRELSSCAFKDFNMYTDSNGCFVFSDSNEPYVLIKKDIVSEDDYSFVGTIIHEITHMNDYSDFMNYHKCTSYCDIANCNYYISFYLWSEFHARRKGYYYLRRAVDFNDKPINDQIAFTKDEYIVYTNALREIRKENAGNYMAIMYEVMQYLGRFSVWNELYPYEMSLLKLPLDIHKNFLTLYNLLYENNEFSMICNIFDTLEDLLKTFYF